MRLRWKVDVAQLSKRGQHGMKDSAATKADNVQKVCKQMKNKKQLNAI